MPSTIHPDAPPLCFWIYGPKASGKTTLARAICGADTITISTRSQSVYETAQAMQNFRHVILDEFPTKGKSKTNRETMVHFETLARAAALHGSFSLATSATGQLPPIRFHLDRFVVIASDPPPDSALRSRFAVISTICTPCRPNSHDALARLAYT